MGFPPLVRVVASPAIQVAESIAVLAGDEYGVIVIGVIGLADQPEPIARQTGADDELAVHAVIVIVCDSDQLRIEAGLLLSGHGSKAAAAPQFPQ